MLRWLKFPPFTSKDDLGSNPGLESLYLTESVFYDEYIKIEKLFASARSASYKVVFWKAVPWKALLQRVEPSPPVHEKCFG